MSGGHRRGVTRGYVGGLVFAVAVVAFALLLVAWGFISLLTGGMLISTPGVGLAAAALIVLLCLAALGWGLWAQSIVLLRGRRSPSWPHVLSVAVGGYLLWCLVGLLAGLRVEDTWLSPYALALALAWAVAALLAWALLVRRVYTDRPTPQWPWEKRGEVGPDWAHVDEDPWGDPRDPRDPRDPGTDDDGDERDPRDADEGER